MVAEWSSFGKELRVRFLCIMFIVILAIFHFGFKGTWLKLYHLLVIAYV